MKEGVCYCKIEHGSNAYVFIWDCPKHGKEWKEKNGIKEKIFCLISQSFDVPETCRKSYGYECSYFEECKRKNKNGKT